MSKCLGIPDCGLGLLQSRYLFLDEIELRLQSICRGIQPLQEPLSLACSLRVSLQSTRSLMRGVRFIGSLHFAASLALRATVARMLPERSSLLMLARTAVNFPRAKARSAPIHSSSRFYIGFIAKKTGAVLGCSPKLGLCRATEVAKPPFESSCDPCRTVLSCFVLLAMRLVGY